MTFFFICHTHNAGFLLPLSSKRARELGCSSGASERANGRANGPVLTSRFMVVLNDSGWELRGWRDAKFDFTWFFRHIFTPYMIMSRIPGWFTGIPTPFISDSDYTYPISASQCMFTSFPVSLTSRVSMIPQRIEQVPLGVYQRRLLHRQAFYH